MNKSEIDALKIDILNKNFKSLEEKLSLNPSSEELLELCLNLLDKAKSGEIKAVLIRTISQIISNQNLNTSSTISSPQFRSLPYEKLAKYFKYNDPRIIEALLFAINLCPDEEAFPYLKMLLQTKNQAIFIKSIKILSHISKEDGLRHLIHFIKTPNFKFQKDIALELIPEVAKQVPANSLINFLKNEKNKTIRNILAEHLRLTATPQDFLTIYFMRKSVSEKIRSTLEEIKNKHTLKKISGSLFFELL